MTTKTKVSTAKKSARKSVKGAASGAASVVVSAAASAVAGVGTSHEIALAVVSGAASPVSVPAGRASDVAALMDQDIKVTEFRQRIAAHWAAPEWSGAAALRASLESIGTLSADQINAAVAAAGRKSGEDLTAVSPSLEEVCEYISANFANEFRQLCGCAVPAAAAVRLYSYSSLSVSTISEDSNINDYLITSAVPSGLSASGLVAVIMSVRVAVDVKRRFAAVRAAGRNDFRASMAAAARRAGRLGVSPAVAARYFSFLLSAVPAADDSEKKRLTSNLSRCWANLRQIENSIILAAPAGAFGAIEDTAGGWVFPASLPASAPAKCRKLWAKRVRVLSAISTLESLLARC